VNKLGHYSIFKDCQSYVHQVIKIQRNFPKPLQDEVGKFLLHESLLTLTDFKHALKDHNKDTKINRIEDLLRTLELNETLIEIIYSEKIINDKAHHNLAGLLGKAIISTQNWYNKSLSDSED